MEPQINSQWKCAQGGGMIITVISKNDERNWDMENMDYKRKGEIIYIYSHNQKIGNMKTFDKERWDMEWKPYTEKEITKTNEESAEDLIQKLVVEAKLKNEEEFSEEETQEKDVEKTNEEEHDFCEGSKEEDSDQIMKRIFED